MDRSETIGQLAAALATAQGQMESASKSANNPFFKSKYADLSAIVDAIKAPLSSNGIAYVQTTDAEHGTVTVETTLIHASGEWLSGKLRMKPVKDDPQGIGSCITYARRYGLQAIVGLDTDDDDGNAASGNTAKADTEDRTGTRSQNLAAKDNNNEQPATARTTPNSNTSNGQGRGDYGDAATSNQQQAIYKMGRSMFGWTDEEVDRQARAWFKVVPSEMNKKQASDMIVKLQAEKDREKAAAAPEQPGMM